MADDWFVGVDGNDASSGATWTLRKLTIDGVGGLLSVAYAAGDRLIVGPGVYREDVTLGAGGGNVYSTGTVSVTNESTTVTGAGGTAFLANVDVGDQFFVGNFASGADGQTYGTSAFTSAGGNFQASMVGFMIEIVTAGSYLIGAVGGAGAITLIDQNNIGWPGAAGPGLTYYVVSGEGPYEVESVDTNSQLTLVKTWSGPTLTGLSYLTYRPVYLIADTTGVETDGVGGVIRLTGTDDDETKSGVRDTGIYADTKNYWLIRGFRIDNWASKCVELDTCTYITFEDLSLIDYSTYGFEIGDSEKITIRRTVILGGSQDNAGYSIDMWANPDIPNSNSLIENVYITGGYTSIGISDCGGLTIKNYTSGFRAYSNISVSGMAIGTSVFVHDSLLHFTAYDALEAGVLGQIVEQFNNFWSNDTDRVNVDNTEANSTTYPYLPSLPLLTGRGKNPMVSFFAPSQWEPTRNAAGLYGKNEDLFGVYSGAAQTRRSWGAMLNYATVRSEDQSQGTFTGSLYMDNAMEQQFVFPVREDWDYTVTAWVYLETNYVGDPPQITVKQPGVASATVTSVGGIDSWEQLSVDFTTGSEIDWINVSLRSRNTSILANVGCYWQDLAVN